MSLAISLEGLWKTNSGRLEDELWKTNSALPFPLQEVEFES